MEIAESAGSAVSWLPFDVMEQLGALAQLLRPAVYLAPALDAKDKS